MYDCLWESEHSHKFEERVKCKAQIKTCRNCGNRNDAKSFVCAHCDADMHCGKGAVEGYTRCTSHGGPVPSRNFYGRGNMTTGAGSSFPITRLSATYRKQMNDGSYLSSRKAVDLIDGRIMQLLERVDVGEAPDRVAKLYELWNEFKKESPHTPEYLMAKKALDDVFDKVYHDYMAWNQIFSALDLRGKTVEREVKALKEIKAIMTAEDGYQLVAKILAATIRVIGDDPKRIKQVQYEFSRLIGESSDNVTEGLDEDAWGGGQAVGGETGLGDVDQAELLYPGDEG